MITVLLRRKSNGVIPLAGQDAERQRRAEEGGGDTRLENAIEVNARVERVTCFNDLTEAEVTDWLA
jgi:hypothetical protein